MSKVDCIWIEVLKNHKGILFGLFYRPPNVTANYFSDIEGSIALAVDTDVRDIILTGDLNLNVIIPQTRRKTDSLCIQFSLSDHQ